VDLDTLHRTLKLAKERKTFEKWRYFIPVPKQEEFLFAGKDYQERLLMAGNRLGKTECAAYEISRHLTGEYPDWWKGRTFDKPVRVWAAGTSGQMVRDTAQEKLCGPPGQSEAFGTGFIPKDAFVDFPRAGRSAPDAFDSLQVRHKSGGISRLVFKTYEQERRHWQGAEVDIVWFDEEPPIALAAEGYTRLGGKGMAMMTFTPLFGMSEVVCRYLEQENAQRTVIRYGIRDATFKSQDERDTLMAGYPPHEREARANGDPLMGSGKVFQTPAIDLSIPTIPLERVPLHWRKLWGLDFGGGSETAHPFAAVLYAWDPEEVTREVSTPLGAVGTSYILAEIRMTNALIIQHVDAIKRIGGNVPVAWPHDGHQKERSSGESMAAIYKKHGLKMLDSHATHPTGGYSTYAGIMDMDLYMAARQWKVADTCSMWFQEYGQYHYKDGVLVKVRDDLMSASRVAHMMRRRALPVPLGPGVRRVERRPPPVINPWTGREEPRI